MEPTLLKLPKIIFSKDVTNYYPEILTNDALAFISALHEKFNDGRLKLLKRRLDQQVLFDKGKFPEFPRETKDNRFLEYL